MSLVIKASTVEGGAIQLLYTVRRQALLGFTGGALQARAVHKKMYDQINEFLNRPEVAEAHFGGSL